jgi:nitrite reductase (NADH) large subunit
VGLDHVKKIVLENAERRKELYERLLYSLQGFEDPWLKAVQNPEIRRQYEILAV